MTVKISFRRDKPEWVLGHLDSAIAKELENTVRALPNANADVSPGDYMVKRAMLTREGDTIHVEAELMWG